MQGNIKEGRFGTDFFKRFDVVLNGLDNLEARRHVNQMCLAAEVPLIESGTAGYLGQVSVSTSTSCICAVSSAVRVIQHLCFTCRSASTSKAQQSAMTARPSQRPRHTRCALSEILLTSQSTALFGQRSCCSKSYLATQTCQLISMKQQVRKLPIPCLSISMDAPGDGM